MPLTRSGRVAATALTLTVLLGGSGCTAREDHAARPVSVPDTNTTSQATPVETHDGPALAPIAAPEGHGCVGSAGVETLLTVTLAHAPTVPITITGVELDDPRGVDLLGAWVRDTQADRHEIIVDDWPGDPGDKDWARRVRAVGARRPADHRFAVMVHLHPSPQGKSGFSDIVLTYRAHGTSYTTPLGASGAFGGSCSN